MEKRLEEPGFWDNPEVSQQVMKELKGLQDSVKEIEKLFTDYEDMLLLIEMSEGEDEEQEAAEEIEEELDLQWQIYRLLKDCEKRDVDLILSLRNEIKQEGISNIGIKIEQ